MTLWHPADSAELRPLLLEHYSRRRPLAPGARLGGVGTPLLLATTAGSAFVAVFQRRDAWGVPWRSFPSWWVGAFRRATDDPARASELVAEATARLQVAIPGPCFTTVDLRHVRSSTPGLCFMRAGWRPLCSTRPLKRSRSLLVLWRGGGFVGASLDLDLQLRQG